MTERLSVLLHDEAQALPVPPPPSELLLARGRRERRRRTALTGLAAAAAFAVVGGSVALATSWTRGPDAIDPATPPAIGPAYSVDGTVHLGTDDVTAKVRGTVHSFHYTSAGVLVRSNARGGASDGSGPETLTLVRPDGSATELGTVPEGVGPATDPNQPYYALAEAQGPGFVAVVRDVTTGDQVGRAPLPDLPASYWDVPPLALSGDTVYAGFRDSTAAVDWRTGETRAAEAMGGGIPEVSGSRTSAGYGDVSRVLDVATGEVLLEKRIKGYGWFDLSPDGRYALLAVEEGPGGPPPPGVDIYDVATGSKTTVEGHASDWGWTSDGRLFSVDIERDTVTTCEPATGDCQEREVELPEAPDSEPEPVTRCTMDGCFTEAVPESVLEVRLGGRTYES